MNQQLFNRPAPASRERPARPVKTIYGVYGLTEWEIVIPAGRARVRIRFAGGSMSSLGVTPATFSTTNRAIKELIEASPQFISGRIVKLTAT